MSGPKAADVRPKLKRAVEEIQREVNQAQKTSERLKRMDSVDIGNGIREANGIAAALTARNTTAAMNKYAAEEVSSLGRQRAEIQAQIERGRSEQAKAEALESEAIRLHNAAVRLLQRAVNAADSAVQGMADSDTGWYLYDEQRQAEEARREAKEALDMERQASSKVQEALEHKKNARNAYSSASKLGSQYLKRFDNVSSAASEMESAARIAEENQRKAMECKSLIESTLASLQNLNHEKFAPGEYFKLQPSVTAFHESLAGKNFATAYNLGESLSAQLHALEEKVVQRQNAFESAQISAQNNLKAAKEEIASFNQADLVKWTGEAQAVTAAFDAIQQAESRIAAEDFSTAENLLATNLAAIREFAKLADERANAANQRMELAEVIMNALYEQGYDSPIYYYSQQNNAGEDVEYSDLTIFAKAPGVRGDMRMNIDLEGKVKLEVEGIAEGEETACHKLITDLQQSMNEEIDFKMTDWGRAAGIDSNAKVAMRQQMKEQERIRERQNG